MPSKRASLELLERAIGIEPTTFSLGSRERLNNFNTHSDSSRAVHGIAHQSVAAEVGTANRDLCIEWVRKSTRALGELPSR